MYTQFEIAKCLNPPCVVQQNALFPVKALTWPEHCKAAEHIRRTGTCGIDHGKQTNPFTAITV